MTQIYRPLATKEFSTNNAISVYNQINENTDAYYLSIGRTTTWGTEETDNLFRPPMPEDTEEFKASFWNQVIGYIKIDSAAIRLVEPRRDWGDPEYSDSKTYEVNELTVTNTISANQTSGQKDGYMVYRCLQNPGDSPLSAGTTFPTGTGSAIDTSDGYVWEYLYTIPQDEISKFVTPEWIVVPTPAQIEEDGTTYWGREDINTTVFDKGRIAYDIGVDNIMFYTLIEDTMFTDMIVAGESFRQIGIVINPYTFSLAIDVQDLDADPVYFSETGEGGASVDGWKIIASRCNAATYLAEEVLIETGEILYMENRAPISRSFNQLEEVKIIMSF